MRGWPGIAKTPQPAGFVFVGSPDRVRSRQVCAEFLLAQNIRSALRATLTLARALVAQAYQGCRTGRFRSGQLFCCCSTGKKKPRRLRGCSDLVALTGFEPAISALRGRCPKPLDDRAICGWGSRSRTHTYGTRIRCTTIIRYPSAFAHPQARVSILAPRACIRQVHFEKTAQHLAYRV